MQKCKKWNFIFMSNHPVRHRDASTIHSEKTLLFCFIEMGLLTYHVLRKKRKKKKNISESDETVYKFLKSSLKKQTKKTKKSGATDSLNCKKKTFDNFYCNFSNGNEKM